ncbi:sulfatase-like hydrolase/transferase [Tichowtungia aerotolerans]|uniref:Sulfatase-like hydrolase/transferase n=1 Tax=Tichowtungia aerotolerans TaxID=2697043 RepID=A0A6P1M113_9BACT|nr:sulfatase-like hydrolase/transferase [Tichowtungia aerotolerans]QHI68489.1 sulfatase-like hydrolase/transferase [Tichowtungia aerotolerans]
MRVLAGVVFAAVFPAVAANWLGTQNRDWSNGGNWQGGSVPGSGDHAYVYLTPNDPEITAGSNVCKNVYLPAGWQNAGSATLTIDGGSLNAAYIYCGSSSTAHTGNLLVRGGSTELSGNLVVGQSMVGGDFTMTGGTLFCNALKIATDSNTVGAAYLYGGEAVCSVLKVGDQGTLDMGNGQLTITDSSARMAVRLLIDQGKITAYGGAGRIVFGSVGTDLVLTAKQLTELAQLPSPSDLTTQIDSGSSTQLSWTAGTGAVSHNLYFSTNASEIIHSNTAFVVNQTETVFDTPVLFANTVYYWRVDEVTGSATNRGDIWSFRTDNPGVNRPTLGVIRWDMYSGMAATQGQELGYLPGDSGFLAPEKWNWRAPFFCRYTNDVPWIDHAANGAIGPLWFNSEQEFSMTQEATEQEIAFAGTTGAKLDYWIFGTAPASAGGNGWGLTWNLDAFLESERRLEINYAMMFRLDSVDDWAEFDLAVDELVWHAKQPNYQTVMGDRPIIYLIHYKDLSVTLGDPADGSTVTNLAAAAQMMRDAFSVAGLPEPYLVATAVPAHSFNAGNWIDGAGFDAGNDYRGAYGGSPDPGTTFANMGDNIEPYWDLTRDNLSAGLIPAAPCGANSLPRDPHGLYNYDEPVPGDLTALMNRVMDYIVENPVECEANTFSMYSWNEHSEGGFLCPLMNTNGIYDLPDTRRLDEVGAAVNAYEPPTETALVFVREDGAVYRSLTTSFDPVFAFDLTAGTNVVVSAAADDHFLYGLLDNNAVVRADLLGGYFPNVQTIGSFSGVVGTLTGLDVKGGAVYAVDDAGRVYKNFSSTPEITLSGSGFVDFAAQSSVAFRGLYNNGGPYAWTRDQDNTYGNFSNNGGAAAISSESGDGYYVLRDDGFVYGPDAKVYQGNFSSNAVDITVVGSNDLYTVDDSGAVVSSLGGGGESTFGTLNAGASAFVAIDRIEFDVREQLTRVPNVIVILTDDHGYTDLGVHGIDANVDTPAMDTLVANGALMTSGYASAPQCAPSRAGLLTGQYQNRFGFRTNNDMPLTLDATLNAERLRDSGYATGFVGKWHVGLSDVEYPRPDSAYEPSQRGFTDYWTGKRSPYTVNYDLAGTSVSNQVVADARNRITVQGEAAEAFIGRHADEPFCLHLALFGPHIPRIDTNDVYYTAFPELDYPNYSSDLDDVRRQGLAMIKAIDDAVDGVMQKLRDLGIEEDTLVLFASDNGSNPKFWETVPGTETLDSWTGSENIPRRGEKGSLWEGGINVPMWVYWKGTIPGGQVVDDPVITLDFAATALKLASGSIPPEYDGVDLLPRLSGMTGSVERVEPLFWDYGDDGEGELAIRKGDWKMRRSGAGDYLFNLAVDPNEQTNLVFQCLEKQAELEVDLMAWQATLPPDGRAFMGDAGGDMVYINGAPEGTPVDARYLSPLQAYPSAIVSPGAPVDSDGDGMSDSDELAVGRNPTDAGDLAFEFNKPGEFRFHSEGDFEGWRTISVTDPSTTNGLLVGMAPGEGKIVHSALHFDGDDVPYILVRMRSAEGAAFRFYWAHTNENLFASSRLFYSTYNSNRIETLLIPLAGDPEWDGQTITQLRVNPVNILSDFEIDYICASSGNLDGDAFTDAQEVIAGTDAAMAESLFTLVPTAAGGLQWNGKAGRSYTVWQTPQLMPADWTVATNIGVLSSDQLIELSLPASPTSGFYRVEVAYP